MKQLTEEMANMESGKALPTAMMPEIPSPFDGVSAMRASTSARRPRSRIMAASALIFARPSKQKKRLRLAAKCLAAACQA
jgi:hypothetical protein